MKRLILALGMFLALTSSPYAVNYVDTSGNIIKAESLGEICRPQWTLDNGDIMVFGTSKIDVALLKDKLIESGITDKERLDRWIRSAQNTDCTNRAGLNCSAGKCSSGSCQADTTPRGTACLCK